MDPNGRASDLAERGEQRSSPDGTEFLATPSRHDDEPRVDGVLHVGPDGRIRAADEAATRLLADRLPLDEPIPALFLGGTTVTMVGSDEAPDIEWRLSAAEEGGWSILVADVSRRRSPERQAADLVGTVAHELKTPLAAIAGFAGTLIRSSDQLSATQRAEFLAIIERQATRLGRVTADLLALSRADTGTLDVDPEPVVLTVAVTQALELLSHEYGPALVVGEVDVVVDVDQLHLQEIVTNLAANAFKYGEPPVTVEVTRLGDEGLIRVCDEGPGVPPGFVPRMWTRFSRARPSERPRGASGSGLGLALVGALVEANAGRVWYEPGEPSGACFAVAFPLSREEPRD